MAMCYQSNCTFLFLLFQLCDVRRVAVTDCFELINNKKFIFMFCNTFFYRNIFLKHPFSAKSNDLYCLLLMGHHSRPYNKTGKHLTFNSYTVTSSDAAPATFQNTALKARQYDFLAFVNEQSKFLAHIHVLKSSHDVVTLMILVMIGKRFDFVSTMMIASACQIHRCGRTIVSMLKWVFYTTVY